ncbi:hypothetical protein ANTPLA_LOCUS5188 [Anthophora plagiata]
MPGTLRTKKYGISLKNRKQLTTERKSDRAMSEQREEKSKKRERIRVESEDRVNTEREKGERYESKIGERKRERE